MFRRRRFAFFSFTSVIVIASLACGTTPAPATNTPAPTETDTAVPTRTATPSPTATLRPTRTPNLAATARAEELQNEVASYLERGYISTDQGRFRELDDYVNEWAQLGWYNWLPIGRTEGDFFLSAHFAWTSAIESSNTAGCGFIFSLQENGDHYAVFLDRSIVFFLITDRSRGFSRPVSPIRGSGRVDFDYPAEAAFTLSVKGNTAYILVDDNFVGQYGLARSRPIAGDLGLTVLSGTNRDFGTRCEMTNLHLWTPTP